MELACRPGLIKKLHSFTMPPQPSLQTSKITLARRSRIKLFPGSITDADGTPIMEEVDAPAPGVYRILPLGSTRDMGSHKGYGLAGVVDIFSGILTGGGYVRVIQGIFATTTSLLTI